MAKDGHSYESEVHSHTQSTNRGRLLVAFSLTASVFLVEVIGAVLTRSLALLIDSAHMLTDVGGLLLALFVAGLTKRPANSRRTWGYGRAEILSAALQAGILFCVGVFVFVEGIRRLFAPPEIPSGKLLLFGVIGLATNGISILVLVGARKSNFNMRAAFLEVVNDTLGSLAVVIASIVISITGWMQADAVAAMLIGALILPRTLKLLRETVEVLMESTPDGLDIDSVRSHILELEHVQSVHDLHATHFATGLPVLTAHVVVDDACFYDGHAQRIIDDLQKCVAEHFEIQIQHSTFQLESPKHAEHEYPTHA